MSDKQKDRSFGQELGRELRATIQTVQDGWARGAVAIRNEIRRMLGRRLDYMVLPIGGSLPERAGPPRSFIQRQLPLPPDPLSFQVLNRRLQAIADADNVKGVVFIFTGFTTGLAKLQNFCRSVERLRTAGKEVVIYTPYLDVAHFFAATAANRIIIPPSARFEVLGLRSEAIFLKDALAQAGVQVDVIQISPYKTAGNMFSQSDITPEQQEQLNWLLDESFDMITAGIAGGRNLSQAEVKRLIDQAPFSAEQALAHGLVDDLAYEDELAFLLAARPEKNEAGPEEGQEEAETASGPDSEAAETKEERKPESGKRPRARLMTWPKGRDYLMEKARRHYRKQIGVVSLEGLITMGPSRQPPVDIPLPFIGGQTAGEQTINQMLRQAERDDRLAALIFHVDSRGGSALASDLIWRQVEHVSRKVPVLVYMGDVAASGGYYVSAGARHIMSQSGTITGSIGVLLGRLSTSGLYEKVHVNRVTLNRGEHAGLYSDETPLSEEERQILWASVVDIYEQFKQVVGEGRDLPVEELDPICEGRVWSGRQARHYKLVDSHGDFEDGVCQAKALAGLPDDKDVEVPVVNYYPKEGAYLLSQPLAAANEVIRLLTTDVLAEFKRGPMLLMPYWFKHW